MKKRHANSLIFIIILFCAMALRLPGLTQRPMHTDEAVHAIKFGTLLEDGVYTYDLYEYHGPTLNYFTLIPAWLNSARTLVEINETTLRIVPVFFGIVLILLLMFLKNGLSWPVIISSALFTAISPAMVYYSRYYIQEMLLVCFTLGVIVCGYCYLKNRNIACAMASGIFIGLMHATKETFIIAFGAMGLALLLTVWVEEKRSHAIIASIKSLQLWHVIVIGGSALLISALFYSSFFTNAKGIVDSFKTYSTYFHRAGHNEIHVHPWFYYLNILMFYKADHGPVWSEILIVLLSCVGLYVAIVRKGVTEIDYRLVRFIAFYTIIMALIYSLIPYKTPWNMLGFLHGMILLAGIGVVALVRFSKRMPVKISLIVFLVLGISQLTYQTYQANYRYAADPCNPYVYAHTTPDIFIIVDRIEEVAKISPQGYNLYIEVICPGGDYWPLPWYLRTFPNVGWWSSVDVETPAAPLILASPDVEDDLINKIYELPPPGERNLYLPLFDSDIELRPHVEIRGYVIKELWDFLSQ